MDHWTLMAAYGEKNFRECPGHSWYLEIDRDNWSITCDVYRSDYYYVDERYSEEVSAHIAIGTPKRVVGKDSYTGEINDMWLEVETR